MRLLFSGIGIVVYTGLCAYIGARLFAFARYFIPWAKAPVYWTVFITLCYVLVFAGFIRAPRLIFLNRAGSYWMAVFVYLLLLFTLFDLLRVGLFIFHRNVLTPRFTAAGIGAALCICFIIITYGAFHARSIRSVQYAIRLDGQGDGLRVALVSDLHIGSSVGRKHIAKVVDIINREEPDIVCVAGDIFDGNLETVSDLPGIAAEFRRIRPAVYACLGNHDVDRMFFSEGGTERIEAFLREAGIKLLKDEVAAIRDNLYIAGRKDARPIGMKSRRKTAAELLAPLMSEASAPAGSGKPGVIIVLDHQPTQFAEIEAAGADMVLCGHTHRGQIFPANLITKSMYRKAGASHYGYWRGNTMQAVITSGAGYWGPPLRVATNSEVAIIDVTFGETGK